MNVKMIILTPTSLWNPLPVSATAYAHPSVYAQTDRGTSMQEAINVDSTDEEMEFDYDTDSDETFRSADAKSDDVSTDEDILSVTSELDRLSPAFKVKEAEGTSGKPINLASSSEDAVTPTKRSSESNNRKSQLFSDTSDESKPDEETSLKEREDRSSDIPPEDSADAESDGSETKEDVVDAVPDINPYPYDLMLYPDIFVFTGWAMNFNERPLDADAAQRSFNHFYLEEQIERSVRLARLEEDSALGSSTYSYDPALVEVMSVLCPSYASAIKQAIKSGLDEDAVGIFSYESNDDEDQENVHPNVRRQLPPPDFGLAVIDYSLHDLIQLIRSGYWCL